LREGPIFDRHPFRTPDVRAAKASPIADDAPDARQCPTRARTLFRRLDRNHDSKCTKQNPPCCANIVLDQVLEDMQGTGWDGLFAEGSVASTLAAGNPRMADIPTMPTDNLCLLPEGAGRPATRLPRS